MTIIVEDVLDYKPYLEKMINLDRFPDALNNYIDSAIEFGDTEFNNYIDLTNDFLIDNQSFKNVYLQYIIYLYFESLSVVKPTDSNIKITKENYEKYISMFHKFVAIYENEVNDTDTDINNSMTLKFG